MASTCVNWKLQIRCTRTASGYIYDGADGPPEDGEADRITGVFCRQCAVEIIDEYQEKLDWTLHFRAFPQPQAAIVQTAIGIEPAGADGGYGASVGMSKDADGQMTVRSIKHWEG